MEKRYDITYSTEVETNNPLWAKPYAKGKIKVLFMPSIIFGMEIIELIKRMGFDYETVTVERMWDMNIWGLGDYYGIRGSQMDFSTMFNNMEAVLTSEEHFDVLVIPGIFGWGYFTPKTKEAILRRVKAGAGLVLIRPAHGNDLEKSVELDELSPLIPVVEEVMNAKNYPMIPYDKIRKDQWEKSTEHYITNGIPLELFPFEDLGYYEYGEAAGGEVILRSESGLPIGAVKQVGEGRVIAFGYHARDVLPNHHNYHPSGFFDSNMDKWKGGSTSATFKFQEYAYGLIGKSIIWAAKKEANVSISSTKQKDNTLQVLLDGEKNGCKLECTIKNAYDEIISVMETDDDLQLMLPDELKLGGKFRVDIRLFKDGLVSDWATHIVEYPLTSTIESVTLDEEFVHHGESLTGTVTVTNGQGELILTVIDYFDYVHEIQKFPLENQAEQKFTLPIHANKSMYLYVHVEIRVNGFLVDKKIGRVFSITDDRNISDFETLLVGRNRGLGEFDKLTGERFRNLGITGNYPGSNRMSMESGVKGMGVYWYNRKEYADRKEKYFQTMDKKYLHREPCLNDPEFWAEMQKNISNSVTYNKKFKPLSYFANDEGSLTAYTDEQDLCFCPHCMNGMHMWLQSEYSDLETLNSYWGTTFANWEEVEPYTYEEALSSGDYASWGDHRRYMELSFSGAYKKITGFINEIDPDGVTRLSGCQSSSTYSGYDYYQLHQHVGYVEAYSVGNQYEMHRSFAKPETTIGGWFGYGNSGMRAKHFMWNGLFHGLTLYSLFHDHAIVNPDMTYSQSAKDIGSTTNDIRREGIGKLLLYGSTRDHLGIAVHYSMNSVHGSYMKGQHIQFTRNRAGWFQLLEDLGYQYQLVASQQIETDMLLTDGYKVLILPYSIAISNKEADAIKRFVQAGGVIIGDYQTGIMDEHCKEYNYGRLDDVFGIKRLTTYSTRFFSDESCIANAEFPYFQHVPGYRTKGQNANGFGVPIKEKGVRANPGISAFVDDFNRYIPLVTVQETEKGKGVYLNMGLDQYGDIRLEGIGREIRELLRKIIGMSDVQKYAELLDTEGKLLESGYESFYYKGNGGAKYIGALRNVAAVKVGQDGVALGAGLEDEEELVAETISFQLPERSHLYDMRKKNYLGYTDQCQAELLPGDTFLLAALPLRIERLEVTMNQVQRRGEEIELSIQVVTSEPNDNWSSTCSISFYEPSGAYSWMYSDNVLINEITAVRTIHVPLNELTGTWKLVVKDVASGVQNTSTFVLE